MKIRGRAEKRGSKKEVHVGSNSTPEMCHDSLVFLCFASLRVLEHLPSLDCSVFAASHSLIALYA